MLSKSAARAFFLSGTALCGLAFIGLTVDTFQRIPAQTRSAQLTDAARRGKHLWDRNNCMGCHTILGEGAYYAPELTRVYQRRGEAFIRAMLHDPQGMYPGERKMQNYHFEAQQIDDLVAFLRWKEEDANDIAPSLRSQQSRRHAVMESESKFVDQLLPARVAQRHEKAIIIAVEPVAAAP